MLKFVSKFVLNVFPSLAASVTGAYIVHNYIYAKPAAPAVTVSTPAWTADVTAIDGVPFAMPIPVVEKPVATETPIVVQRRPEPVQSRNVHGAARTAGERLNVARRVDHAAMSAPQRERVAARGAVVMPAVDLAPDARAPESPAGPPIDLVAATARPGPDRLLPSVAEIPLVRRLSALTTDVETVLVSHTQSAADGVVTAAKSAFAVLSPR